MTTAPAAVSTDHLDPAEAGDVLALAAAADRADGADPLSEQARLRLRPDATAATVTHLLLRRADGVLAGYAQLDRVHGAAVEAELVVHPGHRRAGLGRTLVAAVLGASAEARELRLWAHGDHPSAATLGLDFGFTAARELWQLRRPLAGVPDDVPLPPGVLLRAFRPGEDDRAWLAVNARAFASHPEQGRWTLDDLRVRLAEPWFDPAGFLLAVRESDGRLLGFHWTKTHGRPADAGTAPLGGAGTPTGEVYVLGVDPETHGQGLGRALTAAGLRYLRDLGLSRVMLYVDESNTGAVALYRRLGFARWTTHVQYRRSA